jgi:hypothetical protein
LLLEKVASLLLLERRLERKSDFDEVVSLLSIAGKQLVETVFLALS